MGLVVIDKRGYRICILVKCYTRHYIAVYLKKEKEYTNQTRHFLLDRDGIKIGQYIIEIVV